MNANEVALQEFEETLFIEQSEQTEQSEQVQVFQSRPQKHIKKYGKQNVFEWTNLEKERSHLIKLAKEYKEATQVVSKECEKNGMSRIGCVISAAKADKNDDLDYIVSDDNMHLSENSLKAGKALNALLRYQTMLVDEKNLHIDLVRASIVPILNQHKGSEECDELLSKAKKSYLKKNEIDLL